MENTGGFVTGTLVHTDKGLVPIEQIKVGDMVLSKHESGDGTLEYKRVTKTIKSSEEKELFAIWYEVNGSPLERMLICTKDHSLWIEGKDWVAARTIDASFKLGYGAPIVLSDGQKGEIVFALPIAETVEKNICFIEDYDWHKITGSMKFDFRQTPIRLSSNYAGDRLEPAGQFVLATLAESDFIGDKFDDTDSWVAPPYVATVYNIEVEDFHTYYVGNIGIWVRDINSN